ncbi:hypothetical protein TWF481_010638 [Arthrobotrys musiformis]|uniref:Uncharacterized protein n=1 Tax=Arthrobotrys musiformis TaxID=47236 RepID=A0AAV9W1C5_9PEZI
MRRHASNTSSAAFSQAQRLTIIISSAIFLHSTLTDAFAYVIKSSDPMGKLNSAVEETEICHGRNKPPEGGRSIAQYGVVNWKQSFQAQAVVFYETYECSENRIAVIVRLLNERTGVQYVDMSGPNISPNIRGFRAINLDRSAEAILYTGRRATYEEAKRMVPGSMYIPRLPGNPTLSSYCIGNVVKPSWSGRFDLSSDDPKKWDVYKTALIALRTTFNEVKDNPDAMKVVLGINPLEIPRTGLVSNPDPGGPGLENVEPVQERIDDIYRYMGEDPAEEDIDITSRCIIIPAGSGVPDMADLIEDPSTTEETGNKKSSKGINTGKNTRKKQKLSAKEQVPNSDTDPLAVDNQSRPILVDQGQAAGALEPKPKRGRPRKSPLQQPPLQPPYNPPTENTEVPDQNRPAPKPNRKSKVLMELEGIVEQYSKIRPTKKDTSGENLEERIQKKKQSLEPDRAQLKKEIKAKFQNVPPVNLIPAMEEQFKRIHEIPRRGDISGGPGGISMTGQQDFTQYAPDPFGQSDSSMMAPPQYLFEERQRRQSLMNSQEQMFDADAGAQFLDLDSTFGNNNLVGQSGQADRVPGENPIADFEALMNLFSLAE